MCDHNHDPLTILKDAITWYGKGDGDDEPPWVAQAKHLVHEHKHDDPEQDAINEIKKDRKFLVHNLLIFSKNIRLISSPVDLYLHDESFKEALNRCEIILKLGTKADHKYKHAYCLPYSDQPGCVYTILTNHNLDNIDNTFPWCNYDLFSEEDDYGN